MESCVEYIYESERVEYTQFNANVSKAEIEYTE